MSSVIVPLYRRTCASFPGVRVAVNHLRWNYHYNYPSYWLHRLRGYSYRQWYAKVLDSFATYADAPDHIRADDETGAYQLEYLRRCGLKPHHTVLDFGCGYLRAGVHFVAYLDPGHYVGLEISAGRLDQGRRLLRRAGLDMKQAALIVARDLSLAELDGRTFDFIWSHGVLGHMPPADVEELFANLHKIMTKESVFYANYTESAGDYRWEGLRHCFYGPAFFDTLAARYGLRCEHMADWRNIHSHAFADIDRMVGVRLAGGGPA